MDLCIHCCQDCTMLSDPLHLERVSYHRPPNSRKWLRLALVDVSSFVYENLGFHMGQRLKSQAPSHKLLPLAIISIRRTAAHPITHRPVSFSPTILQPPQPLSSLPLNPRVQNSWATAALPRPSASRRLTEKDNPSRPRHTHTHTHYLFERLDDVLPVSIVHEHGHRQGAEFADAGGVMSVATASALNVEWPPVCRKETC